MSRDRPELICAGAGLASCLIALRLRRSHPDARITLVEAGPAPGGNHTWSFHDADLDAEQHELLAPMVMHRWPRQEVRFPGYRRTLPCGYASMTSDALVEHMRGQSGIEIRTDTPIAEVTPTSVVTESGERLEADAVVDARGPGSSEGMVLGFQKFVGREVVTAEPHEVGAPIIMDATVSQADGYRFVYVLPFDDHRMLIEDTRYSDGAALDRDDVARAVDAYATDHGWRISHTVREEDGVLPILMAGDFERFWPADPAAPARAGLRAGLFHPTTGYSLPQAMALADAIAERWPMTGPALARCTRAHARAFWDRASIFRLLSRLLFRAGQPEYRYRVLERFYSLSEPLITNFYAGRLTLPQKARVLAGKPPVPFFRALGLVREKPFISRE